MVIANIYGYCANIYGHCSLQIYTAIVPVTSLVSGNTRRRKKMTRGSIDFEEFFQQSLPSFFQQAHRNLHNENINALEYFERRLDDHAYVIRCFIFQCEEHNASDDFLRLLYLLHEDIIGLKISLV